MVFNINVNKNVEMIIPSDITNQITIAILVQTTAITHSVKIVLNNINDREPRNH